MAKKVNATEEVVAKDEKKVSNRQRKEAVKAARIKQKEANKKLRKELEDQIDSKYEELKELKKSKKASKDEVKAIKDTFVGDCIEELKLVRWPSKKEVLKYTISTIVFVIFFALFFTLIDVLFALVKGWLS